MAENAVNKWFEAMCDAWRRKSPESIRPLIAPQCVYYESPFSPPLTSPDKVVAEWQSIKTQKIKKIECQILHTSDHTGIATYRFEQEEAPLSVGVYYVELNDEGQCLLFRQWWMHETTV